MAEKDKKEKKQEKSIVDGILYEREVYSGKFGDGYTESQYRLQGGKLEYIMRHYGPEDRPEVSDWTEIPDLNGVKHPNKIALGG